MYLLYLGSMANKPITFISFELAEAAAEAWAADEFHTGANYWIEQVY